MISRTNVSLATSLNGLTETGSGRMALLLVHGSGGCPHNGEAHDDRDVQVQLLVAQGTWKQRIWARSENGLEPSSPSPVNLQ